jgi:hypothetical protein
VTRRRRLVLLAAAGMLAAAAVGVGLWIALGGGGHLDRRRYLARVSSVCVASARRLQRIGAPGEVNAFGNVISTVGAVVPLLRKQAAAMQAVPAPAGLRPRLDRLFSLNDSSIAALERALTAARRRDGAGVARGLIGFSRLRDRIHVLATAIGINCTAA